MQQEIKYSSGTKIKNEIIKYKKKNNKNRVAIVLSYLSFKIRKIHRKRTLILKPF